MSPGTPVSVSAPSTGRFANKEELVDALFADMVDQVESISIEAAPIRTRGADWPPAWSGSANSRPSTGGCAR